MEDWFGFFRAGKIKKSPKQKEEKMDPNKEFSRSTLALTVCLFLATGLCLHLWWKPPETIENINVFLGSSMVFFLLGIASSVLLFVHYRQIKKENEK